MRLSANTGFLWPDLPFLERIRAASKAGFDAVEFHDEAQSADSQDLRDVLRETALTVCGLNVRMGPTAGCAAIPGSEAQARTDIDAAIRVADMVDAGAIHVLSGNTNAPEAVETLIASLRYALAHTHRIILIEPICRAANAAYFLHDVEQAIDIVVQVDHPRLKILFDCFHVETEHGDCAHRLAEAAQHVGHVQIAGVPGRNEPDTGTLDYFQLVSALRGAGYAGAIGAEYRPLSRTVDGLGWMARFRELWLQTDHETR